MTDGESPVARVAGDVTVVVVTWEQRDLVLACLGSLARQTLAHRILVVDNASTDGTAEGVAEHFPNARILRQGSNRGFAGGVSAALDVVETRFVALLNNDAQADPRWLEASLVALAEPSVVAVTAKLLLAEPGPSAEPASRQSAAVDDPAVNAAPVDAATINNAGVVLLASGYGADRGLGSPDDERFASPVEVFGFSGGAVVMRTLAVKAVGGFDADYFMYYEDTDLSWRLRLAGWRIAYAPDAVVHHLHAASSDSQSQMFAFHNERNRLLTLLADAPLGFAVSKIVRFALTTASLAGKRLIGRAVPDDQVFRTDLRLRVIAAVLSRLPGTLGKRRRLPHDRRRAEVFHQWVGVTERPIDQEG
jgi:GT2 family glycosyltransferase